ncbi:hypothetical protein L1049_001817 [Liquidambar formosana]|uniref:Uncharacterized protein n=1 Tax=Liquidambar formosana TaxID=63359 RepID=A0AAP0R2L0_LIQFO
MGVTFSIPIVDLLNSCCSCLAGTVQCACELHGNLDDLLIALAKLSNLKIEVMGKAKIIQRQQMKQLDEILEWITKATAMETLALEVIDDGTREMKKRCLSEFEKASIQSDIYYHFLILFVNLVAVKEVHPLQLLMEATFGVNRRETVLRDYEGNSREDTPRSSSGQLSPITATTSTSTTVNLIREYTLAVQTTSYNEIWSMIHVNDFDDDGSEKLNELRLLSQVLHSSRQCVEEALRHTQPSKLTRIVSSYFDHSENTSNLCSRLYTSIYCARELYAPLLELLDVLPFDAQSLAQSQWNWAFNLDLRPLSARSRLRCTKTGEAICLIGATMAVAVFAIAIATHALIVLVASGDTFFTTACLLHKFSKKEHTHIAKLDAAAKGIFVLNNDLDTIDQLVGRLYTDVESDKLLIWLGLERGRDKYSMQEVVKHLRKNHQNFLNHLNDLEEHICLCSAVINRTSDLLTACCGCLVKPVQYICELEEKLDALGTKMEEVSKLKNDVEERVKIVERQNMKELDEIKNCGTRRPIGILGVLLLLAVVASRDMNTKEESFVMLVSSVVSLTENSREYTPRSSSGQLSPITATTSTSTTVNLTREYTLAVQTSSYNEIWSTIHVNDFDNDGGEEPNELRSLSQVLRPSRQCVEEALRHARPNKLTRIVSSYFDHSENTSDLCFRLYTSVRRARELYTPLLELLDVLPFDAQSLAQSQCDWAFNVFLQFDSFDNPFPSPDSHNFHNMRRCFSELKQQLDSRRRSVRSRLRRTKTGGAICLIGATVAVAVSAVAIATHALVVLVAGGGTFFTTACLPHKFSKKEQAHIAKLDAAAKGIFVLNNDLDTIDRLVGRLHNDVESDKLLIRLGLERGRDKYSMQEVVKHLRKNHRNFLNHLKDLEEHICLCFAAVNRARSLLLQEICLQQTCNS